MLTLIIILTSYSSKFLYNGAGQDQGRACRLPQASAERLEHTGLAEWVQCHKVSNWQGRQNLLCWKKKRQSHLSQSQDREMEGCRMDKNRTLKRQTKVKEGVWIIKRKSYTVKKDRYKEKKDILRCGRRRKRKPVVNPKTLSRMWRLLVLLQAWQNLKWESRLKDQVSAYKMTGRNELEWPLWEGRRDYTAEVGQGENESQPLISQMAAQ